VRSRGVGHAGHTRADRLPPRQLGGPTAEPLLQRIQDEIRARLRQAEPTVHEYARLKTALAALDGVTGNRTGSGPAPTSAPAPDAPTRRRPAASRRRSTGRRAPRGANRAAVLGVLEQRPGVSLAELASASGVRRPASSGPSSTGSCERSNSAARSPRSNCPAAAPATGSLRPRRPSRPLRYRTRPPALRP